MTSLIVFRAADGGGLLSVLLKSRYSSQRAFPRTAQGAYAEQTHHRESGTDLV